MKIAIFGTGHIYEENKERLDRLDEITAFLDNNVSKQGKLLDGICINPPRKVQYLDCEKIILMSDCAAEMRDQLLELGCVRDTIVHWREYFAGKSEDGANIKLDLTPGEKNCLILTSDLGYHGGALTAVYAAQELGRKGYRVIIAASSGNDLFMDEFRITGIEFMVVRDVQFFKWESLKWVMGFEKVIVNTYPMALCALEISKHRPTALWLHESCNIYRGMQYWNGRIAEGIAEKNLHIYAVSENARRNFSANVAECDIEILSFGIPDTGQITENGSDIPCFALINSIHPIKQQLFFLQTIRDMESKEPVQAEFIIIGGVTDEAYAKTVSSMAKTMENVQIAGIMQRRELEEIYRHIDVVVVPSVYETVSISAVEAMMHGRTCIVSDAAGIAEYIVQGENGFVFRSGDGEDLADKIRWCINHRDKLCNIGKRARKVYEDCFTMQKMGDRLQDCVGMN